VGGAPVILLIQRQKHRGFAQVTTEDKEAIATGLGEFFQHVPGDAKFYKVRLDKNRSSDADDLRRAAQSVVMIHIQLAAV
jgi:hypothetical protein